MQNVTPKDRFNVPYATIFKSLFCALLLLPCQAAQAEFLFKKKTLLSPIYLSQKVRAWEAVFSDSDPTQIIPYLQDIYLQWGYPGLEFKLTPAANDWLIEEYPPTRTLKVRQLRITGGSPHQRYLAYRNLQTHSGDPFDRERFLKDIAWIEHNHFLPMQIQYQQIDPEQIDIDIHLPLGAAWIPTGNLALNNEVNLAVTAGLIVDNPFGLGNTGRLIAKRNNIPFLGYKGQNDIQDWEYILSGSTSNLPIPGMTFGINHYNKVDFIYPGFDKQEKQLVWIRSLGVDLYSGFQVWENIRERQYLRAVLNLTLLEDRFFERLEEQNPASSLTKSGKDADILLMPSFNLSYSDIDDYRIPRNGQFLRTKLTGSLLDAAFTQATFSGIHFWTPAAWMDEQQQWTFLFRSAAGTTFGQNPPFNRGFLNTGNWLVRGATQFSITEKHSVTLSEELHYIYRPTPVELERLAMLLFGQSSQGYFDNWSFDINLFLDQGAYWRDSLTPQSAQFSVGFGMNAITPGGSILGFDIGTPIYPDAGNFSALLRISAPLSFTLYSDWFNTNGFFLR